MVKKYNLYTGKHNPDSLDIKVCDINIKFYVRVDGDGFTFSFDRNNLKSMLE